MFSTNFVIRTDNGTLKQAEDVLNGVRVNITPNPFIGTVVHGLMPSIVVCYALIGRPVIGIYGFCIRCGMFVYEPMKRFSITAANFLKSNFAVTLHSTGSDNFIPFVAMPYILPFATYPRLINLDYLTKRLGVIYSHGISNPMAQIPSRFVGNGDSTAYLVGRHALLGLNHQVHSSEPLPQRKMAVMEDSARSNGELIAT